MIPGVKMEERNRMLDEFLGEIQVNVERSLNIFPGLGDVPDSFTEFRHLYTKYYDAQAFASFWVQAVLCSAWYWRMAMRGGFHQIQSDMIMAHPLDIPEFLRRGSKPSEKPDKTTTKKTDMPRVRQRTPRGGIRKRTRKT